MKAFQELLQHLPRAPGVALVLIPHLDPSHESLMPGLLQRASKMPVLEVADGMLLERDHVYVIAPNTTLALVEGRLHTIKPRMNTRTHECIDFFLLSLAREARERALAVILSGTASDGAIGIQAVKAEGGITFAQDRSAEFPGMPQAAVSTGAVDFVLPPADIAAEIVRVASHPLLAALLGSSRAERLPRTAEEEFERILRLLQSQTGVEFVHYKDSTLRRRIARRMALNRVESIEEYRRRLEGNPEEVKVLQEDILIHVTSFFREPATFEALKEKVFPELLRDRPPRSPLRLWVPGCSTGEEAYSLAMALLEFLDQKGSPAAVQVFATDVSERAIARARAGTYESSISANVSEERLRRFFVALEDGRFQVGKRVRDLCLFAKHDLTHDPPFSRLDLLSCRNVMIYLGPLLQKRVFPVFHYALKPTGFLVLGSSETASGAPDLFTFVDKEHSLYARNPAVPARYLSHLTPERIRTEAEMGGPAKEPPPTPVDLAKAVDRLLLSQCVPAGIVVNEGGRVLEIRGRTSRVLRLAPGAPDFMLQKLVREELLPELVTALTEAREKGTRVRREGIFCNFEDRPGEISLEVLPLPAQGSCERFFVVLFEEPRAGGPESAEPGGDPPVSIPREELERENARLRQALVTTREFQQSVIEKLQASNEEYLSTHEEALSANEELQSTNEELETAQEELQSSNEELMTLNEELKRRNEDLAVLSSDLQNVLSSVRIPVAIVDVELRVRRATPAAEKLLNLLPSDLGRRITDLQPGLELPNLAALLRSSIDRLATVEEEVKDREGRWHALQIRPYQNVENKIDGAILVLHDIDVIKRAALHSEEARSFSEAIVETVVDPLLVLDELFRVKVANSAFYGTFRTTPEATVGKPISDLGDGQWNSPRLRSLLEEVLAGGSRLADFEVERDFPQLGPRVMLLQGRKIAFRNGQGGMLLLTMQDITERRRSEDALRQLNVALEGRIRQGTSQVEGMEAFSYSVAHDLRSPLRAIAGFAQLLLRKYQGKPIDEDGEADLGRILEATGRMDNLVQDLLAYSRLSREEIRVEPVDLSRTLQSVLRGLSTELDGRRAQVAVEEPLPQVVAHGVTLSRVLENLVSNAAKFVAPGVEPRVRIHAEARNGRVRLEIEDNGIGIPKKHHDLIFKVFERLNKQEAYPGTGLGLAIARRAMERMGGRVGVESEAGRGSLFWIEFAGEPGGKS